MFEHRHTLFNFKQKFDPDWQSRYLLIDARLALPQIALAVLRLRRYTGGSMVRLIANFNPIERAANRRRC
jgi:phosphatidylglycerol lysyltransferase